MSWQFLFVINSVFLGVGLAMDAFSVSVANGLHDPGMKKNKMLKIAGTFSLFQFLMPMIGWVCVHTIVKQFQVFEKFIPWIALFLLVYIGGKMIYEAVCPDPEEEDENSLDSGALFLQGVATSIDALSVGFTISDYDWVLATVCSLIVAAVTLCLCIAGVNIGEKFGNRFSGRAEIAGGVILILIGLEIFVQGVFL
ncbi:MAG: manganese efflux pump MntP family protein [Clostridiales bacterium]|nr:manganese efflux pump MntP family protein [Clostridiales bacterium]